MSLQVVPWFDATDSLRGSGHDQVAGLQLDQRAQVGDRLRHLPDLLREVALLAEFSVDAQVYRSLAGMADGRRWPDRTHRSGAVEALRHVPGPASLLRLCLKVATRHVQTNRIPEHVREGRFGGDAFTAAFQRNHEFDLVMQLFCRGRKRQRASSLYDGTRRLHEEERRLPVGIVTHLNGVLRVVATDAEHSTDWEN